MLKRAERIHSEEDLILPLYEPLANTSNEGQYRASMVSVVTALAIVSSETVWGKLTLIVQLFDTNDSKVTTQCNKVLVTITFSR